MGAPLRMLIVDDSEAERELMTHKLSSVFHNADVRSVADPAGVEKLCQDDRYDCVLLDYNMPGVDGLELARRLRSANAFLPIILVTGVGDEMLVTDALHEGVSDYITKTRFTGEAALKLITRAILVCGQARLIHEQRTELEHFAHTLAHDFKQPLRQIMIFSEVILTALESRKDDETKKHLRFLSAAADRLGKLVDVMTQYTLLNERPELEDVALESVFLTVQESLRPFLVEHHGQLILLSPAPVIRANETLMIQVLQNLTVNGVLYNRRAKPKVEVAFEREGDQWIIHIRDNGIGIDPEFLSEIFKPLTRLHNASEFPGTGLGLTLARKAALAQNGAIWCESVVGQGSVFHIRMQTGGL